MTDDTQRSLGRLEAVQETHDARLTRIEEKLDHIVSVLDRAKGGWRTLVPVAGVDPDSSAWMPLTVGS